MLKSYFPNPLTQSVSKKYLTDKLRQAKVIHASAGLFNNSPCDKHLKWLKSDCIEFLSLLEQLSKPSSLPTEQSRNNALQGGVLYPEQAFQFVLGSTL